MINNSLRRSFALSEKMQLAIQNALSQLNENLEEPKKLAQKILKMSDYFIDESNRETPWQESWAIAAYISYFLPLNSVRLTAVLGEAIRFNFLNGIQKVFDFGAGPGTVTLTMSEFLKAKYFLIEKSHIPVELLKPHHPNGGLLNFKTKYEDLSAICDSTSLVVFSYSLAEIQKLPKWAFESEALMIVEPSVNYNGRRLLEVRQSLIENGFFIYAPCTHQLSCPLLAHSKKDWCHDRIVFDQPNWFKSLEEHLPMKNQTLTMSYILARKTPPASLIDVKSMQNHSPSIGRLVGDLLVEKGKSRQLFCHNSEREFLTWMDRSEFRQEIPRGLLVETPTRFKKVSNEIRVEQNLNVLTEGPPKFN